MKKVTVGLLSVVFVLSSTGISFGQTLYGGDYTRTPDGGYVGGDSYTRTPSGGYVGSSRKNSQPFGGTGRQNNLDRGYGTGLQFPR